MSGDKTRGKLFEIAVPRGKRRQGKDRKGEGELKGFWWVAPMTCEDMRKKKKGPRSLGRGKQ